MYYRNDEPPILPAWDTTPQPVHVVLDFLWVTFLSCAGLILTRTSFGVAAEGSAMAGRRMDRQAFPAASMPFIWASSLC